MKCYIFVVIIFGSNRFILDINELQDEYSVETANKELILKVRVSTDIHISSLVGGGKTDAFRIPHADRQVWFLRTGAEIVKEKREQS
jgi:hypothetical protein